MKPNETRSAIARAYSCEKVSKLWSQGREAQGETRGCSEFIDTERTDQGDNCSCGEQGRLLRSLDLNRERTREISNTNQRAVQCVLWETARGHAKNPSLSETGALQGRMVPGQCLLSSDWKSKQSMQDWVVQQRTFCHWWAEMSTGLMTALVLPSLILRFFFPWIQWS